jgi:hypothetical protein
LIAAMSRPAVCALLIAQREGGLCVNAARVLLFLREFFFTRGSPNPANLRPPQLGMREEE